MKKILLIIGLSALIFSSCKKKDYLTKEQLQEELANNNPDLNLKNWEKLIDGSTYNYKNSIKNFLSYNNSNIILDGINIFESSWRNNHHELVFDLDTTGLGNFNWNKITVNNPSLYPYLSKMYTQNYFYDVLEIIEVTNTGAIFYSKQLHEFFLTDKL